MALKYRCCKAFVELAAEKNDVVWKRTAVREFVHLPNDKDLPLTVPLSQMKSRNVGFDICEQYLQHNGIFVALRPKRHQSRLTMGT